MNMCDIVVFGATGFTGKFITKHLVELCKKSEYSGITWAISGRSRNKLKQLLNDIGEMGADASRISLIVSDVDDEKSLRIMCGRAKVVMNCVGPYTVLGERVVKACIQTGTHYVDITAELHFMLDMYQKYHRAAEDANVLVITACGFGSIPGVIGFTQLKKEFRGVLKTVECYTEVEIPRRAYYPGPNKCLVHYGTWASMVYELQNYKQYLKMKKETFPQPLTSEVVPSDMKKCFFHKNKGRFWLPYVGPDTDIVEMTQRYLKEKKGKNPVHFKHYVTMPMLIHIFILVPAFILLYFLCYFKCFTNLLWKYPRFFSLGYMSHKGPTEQMRKGTKFSFTFTGKGWDKGFGNSETPFNKSMTLKVSGSDPGYESTAMMFLLSAVTILKEYSSMPRGGVITAGAAFSDTQLVSRLNSNGIAFEVMDT